MKYPPGKIPYDVDALSRFLITTEFPLHVPLDEVMVSINQLKVDGGVKIWISSITCDTAVMLVEAS